MSIFQYDAEVPASAQWNAGVQMALPWASSLDVSYVGNHGYNRLGSFQGGSTVNLNAVDFGAAYLPQNQDPTQARRARCLARTRYRRTCCGRIVVSARSTSSTTDFHDTYHSIQTSFNRRFRNGFQFGVNYTLRPLVRRATPVCSSGCSTRRTARSRCAPTRRSTRS